MSVFLNEDLDQSRHYLLDISALYSTGPEIHYTSNVPS